VTLSVPRYFPPPRDADAYGLLGVGGELSVAWLLDAYSHGIFPWPTNDNVLAWWSPDPRAVFEIGTLHVSRRLARTWRSGKFEVSCDRDFAGVIDACATTRDRRRATWLTPSMRAAYKQLHAEGHAHSVEVWHEGRLAGGTYGVAIGAMFAAESMFYLVRDASKVALMHLSAHLRSRGYKLWDIQQLTEHSASLGATAISRGEFLDRVAAAVALPINFGDRLEGLS
jgi:leucyl/phenylalanyl-tRNA--protein transferase